MMLKVNTVGCVAFLSAGFLSERTTLAFVQNGRNCHQSGRTAVIEDNERQAIELEWPVVTFSRASSSLSANPNQAEDADPDLFDYFDPLLSPHLYPKGTSAGPIQKQKFSNCFRCFIKNFQKRLY